MVTVSPDSEHSAAILDALPGQIAVLDRDGVVVSANRSWSANVSGNVLAGAPVGTDYVAACEHEAG